MAIIKYTEYKIICDICYYDVSDYHENIGGQLKTVRHIKKSEGIKTYKGMFLCEICKKLMIEAKETEKE